MAINSVPGNWVRAPSGGERVWIALALVWCLVLTVMMPYWHFKGKQNSTGQSYRVAPADFSARVDRFVKAYKVGEEKSVPIVAPPPDTDIYLLAAMWRWYPILKLKKGQTYRLHVSSLDIQHGFSLLPINMNFQVLPAYDHVLTVTPTQSGDFNVVCNEFCGIGHHLMAGKISVVD